MTWDILSSCQSCYEKQAHQSDTFTVRFAQLFAVWVCLSARRLGMWWANCCNLQGNNVDTWYPCFVPTLAHLLTFWASYFSDVLIFATDELPFATVTDTRDNKNLRHVLNPSELPHPPNDDTMIARKQYWPRPWVLWPTAATHILLRRVPADNNANNFDAFREHRFGGGQRSGIVSLSPLASQSRVLPPSNDSANNEQENDEDEKKTARRQE